MAAMFQDTRYYNCPIDLFLNELRSFRPGNELGLTLQSETTEKDYIQFEYLHGVSSLSWGEIISVTISSHSADTVSLTVHSEGRMSTQIIDLGKNKKNVTALFSYLEKHLYSPSITTPVSNTDTIPTPQPEPSIETSPVPDCSYTYETSLQPESVPDLNPEPAVVSPIPDLVPEPAVVAPVSVVTPSDVNTSYNKTGYFFSAPMDLSDDEPMTPYIPAPEESSVTSPKAANTPAPITVSSVIAHEDNRFNGPTVICSSCGNKIPKSDDKFCPLCGNML